MELTYMCIFKDALVFLAFREKSEYTFYTFLLPHYEDVSNFCSSNSSATYKVNILNKGGMVIMGHFHPDRF